MDSFQIVDKVDTFKRELATFSIYVFLAGAIVAIFTRLSAFQA